MSTDYGFMCVECNTSSVIDNCRSPEYLVPILANLDTLKAAMAVPGIEINSEHSSFYQFTRAIRFAVEHRDLKHTVVVGDEYGRRVTQCWEWIDCPTCSVQQSCKLDKDHDGPCGGFKSKDKSERLVEADKLVEQGQEHAAAYLRGPGK